MNNISIIGRLVKDAEVRTTPKTQESIATFNIAVNNGKDTDFIPCKAFSKTAEIIEKYTSKGKQVGISGRLKTETWEKDGKKNSKLLVYVERVDLLAEGKDEGKVCAPDNEIQATIPSGFTQVEDVDIPF